MINFSLHFTSTSITNGKHKVIAQISRVRYVLSPDYNETCILGPQYLMTLSSWTITHSNHRFRSQGFLVVSVLELEVVLDAELEMGLDPLGVELAIGVELVGGGLVWAFGFFSSYTMTA